MPKTISAAISNKRSTQRDREGGLAALVPAGSLLSLTASETADEVEDLVGGYLQAADLLGQRTAEMHRSLVECADDGAFVPEPFSQLWQRSIYQSIRKQILQTMQLLREQLSHLPEATRPAAQEVLNLQKTLLEQAKAITGHKLDALRSRVHGDFHLGQVLYTGKDFIIIDFEGEPSRSLAERRLKRSPLFDVASMIRSFHYASRVGQFNMIRRGLGTSEELPALAEAARLWYVVMSVAFLRSYLRLAWDGKFLPESLTDMERLLNTYLLEKACYELRYELNNRPDWVDVPIQGILELARHI